MLDGETPEERESYRQQLDRSEAILNAIEEKRSSSRAAGVPPRSAPPVEEQMAPERDDVGTDSDMSINALSGGMPDECTPSIIGPGQSNQFYSCFISYSTKDEDFAKRLYSRLRDAKVRVWFAPEDIKGGEKLYDQVERAIQVHERLLIVLSENSLQSEWVMTEIREARRIEREGKRRKLFPIRLVDYDTLRKWRCFDVDSGKDLAIEVREYFIPDFSNWKNHDSFEKSFERLLGYLNAEQVAREGTPLQMKVWLGSKRKAISNVFWFVLIALVLIGVAAALYKMPNGEIYRVRVTVLDPRGTPTEEAMVWSSLGGELMKVAGGWQAEISAAKKPIDGKLTIYAAREKDLLTAKPIILTLSNDFNPAVTINLTQDDSAKVRGQVVDGNNRAIAGARVCVVGYESETTITKEGGNFELPTHTPVGAEVLLHAEKSGYQPTKQKHPAGNHPAVLVLEK
ncbi:MAG: TIR domain-containing protein [Blastocatellia bacterium]